MRGNRAATREQVVELVSLASRHFPELMGNEDVKRFMGSDGLHISDRQLADYEDQRSMMEDQ